MSKEEHVLYVKNGSEWWNNWREQNPEIKPDFSNQKYSEYDNLFNGIKGYNFSNSDFSNSSAIVAFNECNLENAKFTEVWMRGAFNKCNLSFADFTKAEIYDSRFFDCKIENACFNEVMSVSSRVIKSIFKNTTFLNSDLSNMMFFDSEIIKSNLTNAVLLRGTFSSTNLNDSILVNSNLKECRFIDVNMENVDLSGSLVYGVSAWNIKTKDTVQNNLIITDDNESTITVDNIKIAQFIYLLINNSELRDVIECLTTKVVLVLGRFLPKYKKTLNLIQNTLRDVNYLPIIYDFDKPTNRDTHETITTLARLAHFIIVDISSPRSVPQELCSIVEQIPSLIVQPIIRNDQSPWGMFDHIKQYPWVLPLYTYKNPEELIMNLKSDIIPLIESKYHND